MTKAAMTAKQEALILRLCHELDGGSYRFVDQAQHLLPLSKTAIRGMTATDASLCIDHLKVEIDRKGQASTEPLTTEPPAAPVEGAPSAEEVLAMLGREVTIMTPKGERSGRVNSIVPSNLDGTPALAVGTYTCRVSMISAWTVS